jgi:multimeric flavodoxin WrbA
MMEILILNGSPRLDGNTRTALDAVIKGIKENITGSNVELIHVAREKLSGCINCNACQNNGGQCVMPDDSAALMEKLCKADAVIFGSPVYWWGISSQLKMFVDKMYSKMETLPNQKKKIGLVITGGSDLSDPQYRIIRDQFVCICDYLGWNFAFTESASTPDRTSLESDPDTCRKFALLWKNLA